MIGSSGERPGERSAEVTTISVTSSEGAMIADAKRLNRATRLARQARAQGITDPAPTPPPTPRRVPRVVRTPASPSRSSRSGEAGTPGRETAATPASTVPPGSGEVRMSKREFEAVVRLIDTLPTPRKRTVPPTKGSAQK